MEIAWQGSAWNSPNASALPQFVCVVRGTPVPVLLEDPCHRQWRPNSTSRMYLRFWISQTPLSSRFQSLPSDTRLDEEWRCFLGRGCGCCQDLLHPYCHRGVGCTGMQHGESATGTDWCLLQQTLIISYARAYRLTN